MKIRNVIVMENDNIVAVNNKERKCDECGKELETVTICCKDDEYQDLCGNCLIDVGNLLLGVKIDG